MQTMMRFKQNLVLSFILLTALGANAQGMNWNKFEFEQVNMGEMSDPVLVLESLDNVHDVERTTSGAKASIWTGVMGLAQRHKRSFIPIQYKQRVRCNVRLDVKDGRYRITILNAEGYMTGFDIWLSLDPNGVKKKLQEPCRTYARVIHEHIYGLVKTACQEEQERSDW